MVRSFPITSWNVRDFGRLAKCTDVKIALLHTNPSVICFQETKLEDVTIFKAATFLPPNCRSFVFSPSNGASGGLLTTWNENDWDCSVPISLSLAPSHPVFLMQLLLFLTFMALTSIR